MVLTPSKVPFSLCHPQNLKTKFCQSGTHESKPMNTVLLLNSDQLCRPHPRPPLDSPQVPAGVPVMLPLPAAN